MVLTLLMRLIRVDHCDDLGEGCRKLGPKEQGRDGLPGWYVVEGNRFDLRVRVASRMCACVWMIGWRGAGGRVIGGCACVCGCTRQDCCMNAYLGASVPAYLPCS
jgi:hypothetical protein